MIEISYNDRLTYNYENMEKLIDPQNNSVIGSKIIELINNTNVYRYKVNKKEIIDPSIFPINYDSALSGIVESRMGSGKTENFIKPLTINKKVICITTRQILAIRLSEELGLDCYLDPKVEVEYGQSYPIKILDRFCIGYNSLHKVNFNFVTLNYQNDFKDHILILDEIVEILLNIINKQNNNPILCLSNFLELIKRCKQVYFIDATLDDNIMSILMYIIKELRPTQDIHIINNYTIPTKFVKEDLKIYFTEHELLLKLDDHIINKNHKLYISCDSINKTKLLKKRIIQIRLQYYNEKIEDIEKKILVINQDTSAALIGAKTGSLDFKDLRIYDYVICSPSVTSGVSNILKHFHVIFGFFNHRTLLSYTIVQCLRRIRQTHNKEVLVCIRKDSPDTKTREEIKKIIDSKTYKAIRKAIDKACDKEETQEAQEKTLLSITKFHNIEYVLIRAITYINYYGKIKYCSEFKTIAKKEFNLKSADSVHKIKGYTGMVLITPDLYFNVFKKENEIEWKEFCELTTKYRTIIPDEKYKIYLYIIKQCLPLNYEYLYQILSQNTIDLIQNSNDPMNFDDKGQKLTLSGVQQLIINRFVPLTFPKNLSKFKAKDKFEELIDTIINDTLTIIVYAYINNKLFIDTYLGIDDNILGKYSIKQFDYLHTLVREQLYDRPTDKWLNYDYIRKFKSKTDKIGFLLDFYRDNKESLLQHFPPCDESTSEKIVSYVTSIFKYMGYLIEPDHKDFKLVRNRLIYYILDNVENHKLFFQCLLKLINIENNPYVPVEGYQDEFIHSIAHLLSDDEFDII